MRPLLPSLAALLLVAACLPAAPDLADVAPVTVAEGPWTFAVRVKDLQADATRRDGPVPDDVEAILPFALHAIERASGCRVVPTTILGTRDRLRAPLACLRLGEAVAGPALR